MLLPSEDPAEVTRYRASDMILHLTIITLAERMLQPQRTRALATGKGSATHNEVGLPVPAIFQWMGRRFLGAQWTKFRSLVNIVCLGVAAIAQAP